MLDGVNKTAERAWPEKLMDLLYELASKYPPELHDYVFADLKRTAFHVNFVRQRMGLNVRLCDVGASHSLFPVACGALGMRVVIIDIYDYMSAARLAVFKNVFDPYCVQRIKRDCVTESRAMAPKPAAVRPPPLKLKPGELEIIRTLCGAWRERRLFCRISLWTWPAIFLFIVVLDDGP